MPIITGKLIDHQAQRTFSGLDVTAVYRLHSNGKTLQEQNTTPNDIGVFKLQFNKSLLTGLQGNDGVEVEFQVTRDNQRLDSKGGIASLEARDYELEIIVFSGADSDDKPTVRDSRIVRGVIARSNGKPAVGVRVRVFDRDLRSEQLLREVTTDAKGLYESTYTPEQFRCAEKESADLIVRAVDDNGNYLAESATYFNAPSPATVDLTLPAPLLSEFEQLLEEGGPLLVAEQLGWDGLREDEQHQDFSFLANELGVSPLRIEFMVVSHRFAKRTGLGLDELIRAPHERRQ